MIAHEEETAMTVLEAPVAEPPPLKMDEEGDVRVGGTRVTLDTVIGAFNAGYAAETIRNKYPSLQLADIYAVIAYYLRHQEAIDAFIERNRQEAVEVRRKIEELCPPDNFRERLLARQARNK